MRNRIGKVLFALVLLLSLAASPVVAGTAAPQAAAPASAQSIGSCSSSTPKVTFYENANFGGRTLTACLVAKTDLRVVHWDNGSCPDDVLGSQDCTNDQFSSFVFFAADTSGACAGPYHAAILKVFKDINFQPFSTALEYTNSGTHSSMPSGWNDAASSFSILCRTA